MSGFCVQGACGHASEVFWLGRHRGAGLIYPLAFLPGVWNQLAPRPQRGQEHRKARAEPSGRGWGTGPAEPRIHRALVCVKRQMRRYGSA
jgi:hypothetical protein